MNRVTPEWRGGQISVSLGTGSYIHSSYCHITECLIESNLQPSRKGICSTENPGLENLGMYFLPWQRVQVFGRILSMGWNLGTEDVRRHALNIQLDVRLGPGVTWGGRQRGRSAKGGEGGAGGRANGHGTLRNVKPPTCG